MAGESVAFPERLDLESSFGSFGVYTDLLFFRLDPQAQVDHEEGFIRVATPSNPGFYWGNLLILDSPPPVTEIPNWITIFDQQFEHMPVNHVTLMWRSNVKPEFAVSDLEQLGFEYSESLILVSEKSDIVAPYRNSTVDMRAVETEEDWDLVKQIALETNDEYTHEEYSQFMDERIVQYQRLSSLGFGKWYLAFDNSVAVSSLGLFHDGIVARFQSVITRENYRRQGIAQTLIEFATGDCGCSFLVIEAELDGPALELYKSLGFKPVEKIAGISRNPG